MASFQERIERYKRQGEKEAEEKKQRFAKEREGKLPKLLDLLEKTHCKQLLTEIRDDVWKAGEVSVETPKDKIEATVRLQFKWPHPDIGSVELDGEGHRFVAGKASVRTKKTEIVVTARVPYSKEQKLWNKHRKKPGFFKIEEEFEECLELESLHHRSRLRIPIKHICEEAINKAAAKVEEFLVRETLARERKTEEWKSGGSVFAKPPCPLLPYDEFRQKMENLSVEHILEENLKSIRVDDPSLLKRAQTLREQRRQEVSKSKKSDRQGKKSLWDKIIGK